VAGLVLPLRPWLVFVTQTAVVLLTVTEGYCNAPLLTAPITQQRNQQLAQWLDFLASPVLLLLTLTNHVPKLAAGELGLSGWL
jgi:hypothetical protein